MHWRAKLAGLSLLNPQSDSRSSGFTRVCCSKDDLMQKCKSQIRYSREEVLSVARDSEGSQGKRFEVHPTGGWLRARYRHNGTSNGKGKEGKERRNGSHSGYSYASGTIENTGWDNYQGPESFSSTPPWSSNGILSMYFDLGFVEDMCCW
ncbi:unnamed protein product [Durusdinium trenchii]|uniref:Uncharacterized protein n=1 Tax=Durusdinium trenchii TaxID=1381693 RepID=A0ABP0RUL1_9DINO